MQKSKNIKLIILITALALLFIVLLIIFQNLKIKNSLDKSVYLKSKVLFINENVITI